MHIDLVELGYPGSCDRVAALARGWRSRQQQATLSAGKGSFVALLYAPDEAFQFDWSEDWVVIDGERSKLPTSSSVTAGLLCCGPTPLHHHEMLFDAHNHALVALVALAGVTEHGIYDNMKTAVDKVRRGKRREVNKRFKAVSSRP